MQRRMDKASKEPSALSLTTFRAKVKVGSKTVLKSAMVCSALPAKNSQRKRYSLLALSMSILVNDLKTTSNGYFCGWKRCDDVWLATVRKKKNGVEQRRTHQRVVVSNVEDDVRICVDEDIPSLTHEEVVVALLGHFGNGENGGEILLGCFLRADQIAPVNEHRLHRRKTFLRKEWTKCVSS